jgi:hypothetical protein
MPPVQAGSPLLAAAGPAASELVIPDRWGRKG